MNIAAKTLIALAASAAMTSVVVSGEPDATMEKPIVMASLVIVPERDEMRATLGAPRSMNVATAAVPTTEDNDQAGAAVPFMPGAQVASLYESEAFISYARTYNVAPVPVPTPRPEVREARVAAPAVRTERAPVRQATRVAVARADEQPRKPRFRENGPIFLGMYR